MMGDLVRCEYCGQVYHKSELSCPHCLAPLPDVDDDVQRETPRKEIPYDPPPIEKKLPRNPHEIKELVDDGFIPLKWARDIVVYEDVDTNVIYADNKIYHTLPTRYTFGDWLDEQLDDQEQQRKELDDRIDELRDRVAALDEDDEEVIVWPPKDPDEITKLVCDREIAIERAIDLVVNPWPVMIHDGNTPFRSPFDRYTYGDWLKEHWNVADERFDILTWEKAHKLLDHEREDACKTKCDYESWVPGLLVFFWIAFAAFGAFCVATGARDIALLMAALDTLIAFVITLYIG